MSVKIYINFRFGTYTFQNLKFHQQLLQITGALFPFTLFIPVFSSCSINSAKIREVKIEWTKQLVAQQKQKTERIKKETALQNAKLDAQRVKDVRKTSSLFFSIRTNYLPGEPYTNAREAGKRKDPS